MNTNLPKAGSASGKCRPSRTSTKTVHQDWIETLGMTFPERPRPGRRLRPWTPEAYQLKHVRQIKAIEGQSLRFDVPLPQSFAAEFGGGTVTKIDVSNAPGIPGSTDPAKA